MMRNLLLVLLVGMTIACDGATIGRFVSGRNPPKGSLYQVGEYLPGNWHTSDGTHIDAWYDSSGRGNHLIQNTFAYQPTASGVEEVNFSPNTSLVPTIAYSTKTSASDTLIVVVRRDPYVEKDGTRTTFGNPYPRFNMTNNNGTQVSAYFSIADGHDSLLTYTYSPSNAKSFIMRLRRLTSTTAFTSLQRSDTGEVVSKTGSCVNDYNGHLFTPIGSYGWSGWQNAGNVKCIRIYKNFSHTDLHFRQVDWLK